MALTPEERISIRNTTGRAQAYGITILTKAELKICEKEDDQIKESIATWAPRVHTIKNIGNEEQNGVYTVFFTDAENKTMSFTSLELVLIDNQSDDRPYRTKNGKEVFFDAKKAFELCKSRNEGQRLRVLQIAKQFAQASENLKNSNKAIDAQYASFFGGEID